MTENLPGWAAVVISASALIFAIVSARSKAGATKMHSLEMKVERTVARVEAVEVRATTIENELRHLPDKDVTYRLEVAMAAMGAKVDVLAEQIKPVAAVSQRLQELMFERAERL